MNVYIYPIATAVAIFPLLSAAFTLPYVINQYHKYGALLVLRIILVYSFIFYMMTSYFMTILPLPPIDSVQDGGTYMLLVPFNALKIWWGNCGFVLKDPSTYLPAFMNYNFLQIAFNILLLLPFGVYLRYYFERKWYQVLLISFAYSLFFELTQLSGLYGIYPHAYRWFEVDDLICNTLGGMFGFLITPLCSFFLPSRDRLDEMSYHKGKRVSIIRRGMANVIDWSLISLILFLIKECLGQLDQFKWFKPFYTKNLYFIIICSFFLYFVILSWILSGKTIGKFIVSLRVNGENGHKAKLYQYILRYAILYLLVVPTPFYVFKLLQLFIMTKLIWMKMATGIGISVLVTIFFYVIINVFICAILHRTQSVYDRISHTHQVSVVIEKYDTDTISNHSVETDKDDFNLDDGSNSKDDGRNSKDDYSNSKDEDNRDDAAITEEMDDE